MSAKSEGKTFADVFDSVISSPKKFFAFIGMTICSCGLFLLVLLIIAKIFGVTTAKEIEFSATGAHIVFDTAAQVVIESKTRDKSEYLIMVHPQGWQDTGIKVKSGEHLTFKASGSMTVDLNGIVERTVERHKLEGKYKKLEGLEMGSEDPKNAPETHFSPTERDKLRLLRGWIGPDGYSIEFTDQSWHARRLRKVLPNEALGGLIGAIKDNRNGVPSSSDAFFIGNNKDMGTASSDGELWFNVNDVQNDNDPLNPELFFSDNIGFFWVKVTIEPTSH